jgi:predicted RNase H-like HicB family nuclease
MRQAFHSIIKPEGKNLFVGWVEEIPGTLTYGRSLDECRYNLREALEVMLATQRDEARLALDDSCIQEAIEVDSPEGSPFAFGIAQI